MNQALAELKWQSNGLLPVIATDNINGQVLMQAWCDRDALQLTIDSGYAHYFSRSRNKLWKKGETSNNVQKIIDIYTDCDKDSIIYQVEQLGQGACHTGKPHCFFMKLNHNQWQEDNQGPQSALFRLDAVIAQRLTDFSNGNINQKSYTASLFSQAPEAISNKINEEALELIEEINNSGDNDSIIHEASDLLYHTMAGLHYRGISLDNVAKKLFSRLGISGIEEKNNRTNK